MEDLLERITSILPGVLSGISEYSELFEQFVGTHLGAVPIPVLYLICLVIAGILIYNMAKVLFHIALYIMAPAICSALALVYAFPSLEATKVVPIAAIFFIVLYLVKH